MPHGAGLSQGPKRGLPQACLLGGAVRGGQEICNALTIKVLSLLGIWCAVAAALGRPGKPGHSDPQPLREAVPSDTVAGCETYMAGGDHGATPTQRRGQLTF